MDLFGGALSSAQVKLIYDAGPAGKCANTAPVVDAVPDTDIKEGGAFERDVSFTDDEAGPWTVTVDYDDGDLVDFEVNTTSFNLSHRYAQDGTYTVTGTVTDGFNAVGPFAATVVVNNVEPNIVSRPEDQMIFESEGGTYASSVSFEDPGADEWTAMVDYGDSSVETLEMVEKTFPFSHTYEGNEACGPFTVTVTMMDDDFEEGDVLEEDASASAQVTFIHQISVYRANIKLDRRRRHSRDQLDVSGRLPRSLIECLSREDVVSIEFGGLAWTLPSESLRHRNRWWQKKWFFTGRGSIRRLDFHDNGRFTIQVRSPELRDLSGLIPFSISFGPDQGETEVRIRGRRGRSDRGHSDKSGKSGRSGKSGKSGRRR